MKFHEIEDDPTWLETQIKRVEQNVLLEAYLWDRFLRYFFFEASLTPDNKLFILGYLYKYIESSELSAEEVIEAKAWPIKLVDLDNDQVWVSEQEDFWWILRQSSSWYNVDVWLSDEIFQLNTLFKLIFIIIDSQQNKLWSIGMD